MASSMSTAMRAAAPARRRPARRSSKRRRRGPGRKDNWWPVAIVAALVLLGVAWARSTDDIPAGVSCLVPGTSVTLSSEQLENARTIAAVAEGRGLPERATVIALATAMQESTLRNLDYGDRDSLGLFQQRPSQGWGSPDQVQDPIYAAGKFYDGLVEIPNWEAGDLTLVADAVQRSAYPLAYGRWSGFAESLATVIQSEDLSASCG